MPALCRQDREIIAIWREHGIPLDARTVEHALGIIRRLEDDLATAWDIVRQLGEDAAGNDEGTEDDRPHLRHVRRTDDVVAPAAHLGLFPHP